MSNALNNILLAFLYCFCCPVFVLAVPNAFPGAEGVGRYATGGRGGDVYHVTNLNDSGAGSLRYGLTSAAGPRTIVFEISGNIHLVSDLSIRSDITIAGQTAPGTGVTICDRQTTISGDNIIVRYMRFRPGDTFCPGYQPDSLWVAGGENVIIDHVSASWSIDEVLSTTHESNNVTVQWSMITEALHDSCHEKGNHGYGSLINGGDFSFHHNLYAHNRSRNARPGVGSPGTRLDWINNVIYNPGDRYGYGDGSADSPLIINFIGNYGISGPNTTSTALYASNDANGIYNHFYHSGNMMDINKNGILDGTVTGWNTFTGPENQYSSPFIIGEVTAQSANDAYFDVLDFAGASLVRDPVDLRVINTVINQTGDHIDSPSEVGGWPVLPVEYGPSDTDRDGMPDQWENYHNLNSSNASDRNYYSLHPEYTNLEVYLNSILAKDTVAPSTPAGVIVEKSASTVNLDWESNTDSDFGGYYVYRSTSSGSGYIRISSLLSDSEFPDTTAENDITYYYVITAIDLFLNESGYSNEVLTTIFDTDLYRDVNGDKIIDINDFTEFLSVWLKSDCHVTTSWDIGNDCLININEFELMAASWLVSNEPQFVNISRYAAVSCRTALHDGTNSLVDVNKTEGNKLSVRGDSKASKSWIKFDISDLNISSIVNAQLRVTLYEPKTSTCLLSAVNDDCLDNINWGETDITWNNAPGNYTSSDGVNPDAAITVGDLQDKLDPAKTTHIGTVDYSYGGSKGDQFTLDVLPIIQVDTDGIVQFVLHGAGGSSNFTTHDSSLGSDYWPVLIITYSE